MTTKKNKKQPTPAEFMAKRFGRSLKGRKPLVIYSATHIFGEQVTMWHIITDWNTSEAKSEAMASEAQAVIHRYSLPLVYEDRNGKIWADPENNAWMELKNYRQYDRETQKGLKAVRDMILAKF